MSEPLTAPPQAVPKLAHAGPRIDSLDLLRGLAILGIFLMNTWTMSLPQEAYTNPAAYNPHWVLGHGFPNGFDDEGARLYTDIQPLTGINYATYVLIHLFADMKFITTFSILFGAGIVLQAERASKTGRNPWTIHYFRMTILLLFGLIHTFGFWYGDILTDYALLGMLLAPLRKLPATLLFVMGICLVCGSTLFDFARLAHMDVERRILLAPPDAPLKDPWWSKAIGYLDAQEISMRDKSKDLWIRNLTARGIDQAKYPDENDREVQVYRSGWWDQIVGHRYWASIEAHTTELITWTIFRCGGSFLIGMALQKRRFFHGSWPREAYATIAGFACIVGWMVTYLGVCFNDANNWSDDWNNYFSLWHLGVAFNYYGSLLCALGYLSFGVLLATWAANPARKILRACLVPVRSVGRMALTCYLTETLIGTTLFYGHGFGYFGMFSRAELVPKVVLPAWAGILLFATLWLSVFKQGPLEWIWHSIVYLDFKNPLKEAAGPDASLSPNVQGIVGAKAEATA